MNHYALSFAPCINFNINKLIENNFGGLSNNHISNDINNQIAQSNKVYAAAEPAAVQNNRNKNYDPISFDPVLFMTLQHGCAKNSFLVLDFMCNFSGFVSRRNDYNLFYVCGSYRIKEMDVFSLALDIKRERSERKYYVTTSYLHRFEFTLISFGCDLRLDLKDPKKSSLALKIILDL